MTRRLLITASILALTAGCSSSSSSGTTPDSGTVTQNDSSAPIDTGVTSDDGGTIDDTGIVTQGDTGTVSTGDSGTSGGDAGSCTALATVANVPPYTSVTKQSVCSSADVSAAVTACFQGSATACQTWQAANAACAACAVPPNAADGGDPTANSAIICVDSVGECFVNIAGCLQVKDGNSTCASAYQELNFCEFGACDSPACITALGEESATNTDYQNCQGAADQIACSSQLTAANTACGDSTDSADGGSLQFCQPQTVTDISRIIYAICGNGQ